MRATRLLIRALVALLAASAAPTAVPAEECGPCTLLGLLQVAAPTVEPPKPTVGDMVTLTFPVTYYLPSRFDCDVDECRLEEGEPILAGDEPPASNFSGHEVVVHRRAVQAGIARIQLHVTGQTEEACGFMGPDGTCHPSYGRSYRSSSSPPFELSVSAAGCTGECGGDGAVTIDEIITGVSIAQGGLALAQCAAFDANGDGEVTVDEIVTAVTFALSGCDQS